MDFNQLMVRMRELDQPTNEGGCGMDSPMPPPMSMAPPKPDAPPPSLSINLNAQGMDNIESIMKLMTKVNPDMINQPQSMPMSLPISISKPKTIGMGPLGNLDSGPLKMLPDIDSEPEGDHSEPDADNMGGPSDNDADNMPPMGDLDRDDSDDITKSMGDIDNDGDHDMDDHDAEKKDKDEAFGNSVGDSEPEYNTIADVMNKGDDLNRPKKSFSGKPYRGDNPMAAGAYESKDLRSQIREELLRRLAEAKGAK